MTKRAMTRKEAKAYKAKKAVNKTNEETLNEAMAKRVLEGGAVICNCENLERINNNSIDSGYNRNIYYEKFVELFEASMTAKNMWHGEHDTFVLLEPMMIHEHKQFVRCEKHVRARIYTESAKGIGDWVMIDVRLKDWMRLLAVTEHWEQQQARETA